MNAPPFPTNPSPGDGYCGWTWNGTQWICNQSQQIVVQSFSASGSYIPSPGLVSLVVEVMGAGGGGGPCAGDAVTVGGGGGGGSGGLSRKALSPALVRGGVIVTVGVGGSGNTTTNGTAGTATSFGALCVANGGGGGELNDSVNAWGEGGFGAPVGVGDLAFAGNPGQPGSSQVLGSAVNVYGGAGGIMIGGGTLAQLAGTGLAHPGSNGGPGAGGSGAAANAVLAANPGGNGGNGLCIVTEYCFAVFSSGGQNGCCPPAGQGVARVQLDWCG